MPEATAAIFAPLISKLIFWFITGLVALLVGIVTKLYWDNRTLRKGAIDSAVAGIQKAVEELSKSIKEMAKASAANFSKGEARMDKLDSRVTVVETQCEERRRHSRGR